MPYTHTNKKGQEYILHGKEVTLQNGRKQRIHYFAREAKPGEALDALPAGPMKKGDGQAAGARVTA